VDDAVLLFHFFFTSLANVLYVPRALAEDFGWTVKTQNKENPDSVPCYNASGMLRTTSVVSHCSPAICHN